MDNLTNDQLEKALRVCDIFGIDNINTAIYILKDNNWSIETVADSLQGYSETGIESLGNKTSQDTYQNQNQDYNQKETEQAYEAENDQYQYDNNVQQNEEELMNYSEVKEQGEEIDGQHDNANEEGQKKSNKEKINQNKAKFDQEHQQLHLNKSTSSLPNRVQGKMVFSRKIINQYSKHRHIYQAQLLKSAEQYIKAFLQKNESDPELKTKISKSNKEAIKNKLFVSYLYNNYRCSINFTFGTFMLNLVRSYLDKKYLLVYVHQEAAEESRTLYMIFNQKQIAKLINKNCITYGMFDNSDDYDRIQKDIPMGDLPAFGLYKLDKGSKKQKFLSSYPLFQKEPVNFIEWLSKQMKIHLQKKKEIKQEQFTSIGQAQRNQKKVQEKKSQDIKSEKKNFYSHSEIMRKQNEEYEEMQKIYKMRRQISKQAKELVQSKQNELMEIKKKFQKEPQFEQGKTILIKFRLPSGKSINRNFLLKDRVKQMFDFVHSSAREEFEEKFSAFDLTQTFPRLSLNQKKEKTIEEIFDSPHENILVKQI